MDALAFLDAPAKAKRQPIYVLVGDEDMLKRRCRDVIVKLAVGDGDPEFAVAAHAGDKADLSAVRNDLETLPFFCSARVVMVDQADKFVTDNRPGLERYFAAPSKAGTLVLDVKTFPDNTRLAKALPDPAKLVCKAPPAARLPAWCVKWATSVHGKTLGEPAAGMLVDLVGPSMGLLDRELEKLATAVGAAAAIRPEDVDTYVRRSSAANVFDIMDAVGEARPADALRILARLFESGDDPHAVLGALTYQLRKLAAIGRGLALGHSEGMAMDAAGVPKFPAARQSAAKQVRHLGRRRLALLADWLVEINLGVKGVDPLPNSLQVERLIVRLARPRG